MNTEIGDKESPKSEDNQQDEPAKSKLRMRIVIEVTTNRNVGDEIKQTRNELWTMSWRDGWMDGRTDGWRNWMKDGEPKPKTDQRDDDDDDEASMQKNKDEENEREKERER